MHRSIQGARALSPDYPSTPHWDGLAPSGTLRVLATEKLDGANVGVFLEAGEVRVRNRTHVLRKGYVKDTPAKAQFRPLFGWAHAHKKALQKLERQLSQPVCVYGEWLWAVHGVLYPRLPNPFAAFALWKSHDRTFADPWLARDLLENAGFPLVPEIGRGQVVDPSWLSRRPTAFGEEILEGVVLSWGDGRDLVHLAKWVREDYQQNHRWSDEVLVRQARSKSSS